MATTNTATTATGWRKTTQCATGWLTSGRGEALSNDMLTMTLTPRSAQGGTPEEVAAFGTLDVCANERCLTEGVAHGANDLSRGPLVSGYHIAEWLVWNRWRLLWEARPDNPGREWIFSHCLSSIGEGYVWPNIEVSSDGVRALLTSSPTIDAAAGLYRYVGAPAVEVVSATQLEAVIDHFVPSVLDRLAHRETSGTNLHHLWIDVERERTDGEAAWLRRLEARWGHDPDELDATRVRAAIDASHHLGLDAVEELAADAGGRRAVALPTTEELETAARDVGVELRSQDAVDVQTTDDMPTWGEDAAWRLGVAAAHLLRRREGLAGDPIDNRRLAALAGTQARVLADAQTRYPQLSFVLSAAGRRMVALRSKWETGRRFDLARLLGDRLFGQDEPLLPATRADTYRQKAQRAFAAEFLCPYEAVREFLGDDRSEEHCAEAADHFSVSPWAINGLLVNNERRLSSPGTAPSTRLYADW